MKTGTWLAVAALGAGLVGMAAPASAASNPQAVVVRFGCPLYGVAGTSDPVTKQQQDACRNLKGWFDGKIEWLSNGLVVYGENGPLHAVPDGDNNAFVEVYADGNGDPMAFNSSYDSLNSVLLLPNLAVRLWYRDKAKPQYQIVAYQSYYPYASALWSKHCEDCIQIQADVATLKTSLSTETTERKSDVASLWAAINALGGGGPGVGYVTVGGNQTITGTKTFTAMLVGTITTAVDFLGTLAGDVTGPEKGTRVVAIQGVPVSPGAAAPPDGTVLQFNAATGHWVPKLLCQGLCQDCNNQAADGCESNVLNDANNCGCCGHACPAAPNASPRCAVGACAIACSTGFGDCNGVDSDGCETVLSSDSNNCGGCGVRCGAGQSCVNGACACPTGFANCFGQCVDVTSDANNCGACGNRCPNGLCVNSVCTSSCAMGLTLCNGVCTNLMASPVNCGACGVVCNATQTCNAGVCQTTCAPGSTLCGNQCVNLVSDASNCGGCGVQCPTGAVCNNGVCQASCPPGMQLCSSICVNVLTSPTNCGACGLVCAPGHSCVSGICVSTTPTCNDGVRNGNETGIDCGGGSCMPCANGMGCAANSDCQSAVCVAGVCQATGLPNNSPCAFDAQCASGYCAGGICQTQQSCPAGQVLCGNTCTQVFSDVNNCGGCGVVCPPEPNSTVACTMGACMLGGCATGFANCDNQYFNGCEINVQSDPANCGGCGHQCSSANGVAACFNGTCAIGACNPGFADCDHFAANGCETHVTADVNNCGACGHTCFLANGISVCQNGICGVGACNAGFADCNGAAADGCETNLTNNPASCGACGLVCAPGHSCVSGVCQ